MITRPAWTNKKKASKTTQMEWNRIEKNNMKLKNYSNPQMQRAYHSQFKLNSTHTYNWLDYPYMIKGGALFTIIGSVLPLIYLMSHICWKIISNVTWNFLSMYHHYGNLLHVKNIILVLVEFPPLHFPHAIVPLISHLYLGLFMLCIWLLCNLTHVQWRGLAVVIKRIITAFLILIFLK